MADPFAYSEYRKFLNDLCAKERAPRGFRAALARAAGCQASYLSQVLKERAHLTEDQLLGLGTFLNLEKAELEFLLLLLRHGKAGTASLRDYLRTLIERARAERLNLKHWLDADPLMKRPDVLLQYFSSWIPSAVHLLTSAPECRTPPAIAARLSLPEKKVSETLAFLERNGFVTRSGRQWKYEAGSFHFDKGSPLLPMLRHSRRELVARSLAMNSPESLHFSSLFTLNREELEQIKGILTRAIHRSHKLVRDSGTDRLACLSVDLFEVV